MTPQEKNQLEMPVTEEVSLRQMLEGQEKKYFLEPLILLAKHKFFIIYFVGATAVLSIVISLLLPVYFTADAKMMPPQQGQSFAAAMLDQLGGLGGLVGAAGGKDLLKNPSDLYAGMLHSRRVADSIIARFSLMSLYHSRMKVDAERRLDSLTEIVVNKDGTISISVQDRDPRRAAGMANAYVEELDQVTKSLAVTDASKRRVFFEREAKIANDQLETAEQQLKSTEETTGIIQIDNQSRVLLQAYEDLRAQEMSKEIEIESMRSFATAENPDLVRLENERDALRKQIAGMEKGQGGPPVGDIPLEKVPEKALKYVDKLREVTYRNSLLQLMLKQYEIARVDEAKDSALIQVLDAAVPPERKSSPKRAIIVLFMTFLAFLVAVVWVYFKEAAQRAKGDPHYLERLQLLKFYLTSGHKSADLES